MEEARERGPGSMGSTKVKGIEDGEDSLQAGAAPGLGAVCCLQLGAVRHRAPTCSWREAI